MCCILTSSVCGRQCCICIHTVVGQCIFLINRSSCTTIFYYTSLLVQPPAAGGDPFAIPTSGGEWASSDPFADPFGSDSFGSAGWSGDSLAATASATGVSSSTPKGTKIAKVCTCVSAHY